MNDRRGFTLIELLLATLILTAIMGALVGLALPARAAFDRALSAGDQSTRARAGLEAVAADVRDAGAGPPVGEDGITLADLAELIIARTSLDDDGVEEPHQSIEVVRVRPALGQGMLRERAEAGTVLLQFNTDRLCVNASPCGFEKGVETAIYDNSAVAWAVVQSVDVPNAAVRLDTPLSAGFDAGALVIGVERVRYGIRTHPNGAMRLVRISAGGAEQPLIDHVADFDVSIEPRRVTLRLRVEAADPALRGPVGRWFRRAGTATHAARWVPDLELQTVVAIRNQ